MALIKNKLTKSPHYSRVMAKFLELRTSGPVELKKFHEEIIQPILPTFSYESFRQFMKSYEAESTALAAAGQSLPTVGNHGASSALADLLEHSDANARKGIAMMIGIGLDALEKIAKDPDSLSMRDRALLLAAAMKAQDSRVAAVAKIKQDARDDMAFNRALNKSIYGNGEEE